MEDRKPVPVVGPVPAVGHGSPVGKRWFITGSPGQSFTIQPGDVVVGDRGQERPIKAIRIPFRGQVKPLILQGDGHLGSVNPSGTDANDSPMWGVFYIDVRGDSRKDERVRVDQDQRVLDFLRDHEYYIRTNQDNRAEGNLKLRLKELTWDPRTLGDGYGVRTVARGRQKLAEPQIPAPADNAGERPTANIAEMSGKKKGF